MKFPMKGKAMKAKTKGMKEKKAGKKPDEMPPDSLAKKSRLQRLMGQKI